jgi:hypothetical protein
MPTLRPYQQAAIDAIYGYFAEKAGHPLVVIPTDGGKSLVMAAFIEGVLRAWPDQRVLVVTHVRELIAQNFAELIGLWREAPAGIYSAGLGRRDLRARVLFAGIQSIHRCAYDVQQCDLVLIDEAHLIPGSSDTMYRRFLDTLARLNPQLKVIGFTATPYRLDSGMLHEGKGALFTEIAYEVSVRQLIDDGFLCPLVSKAAETRLDVSGVGSRGGEFTLAPGLTLRLAPLTTALMVAARADLATAGLPETAAPEALALAMAKALARRAVLDWTGRGRRRRRRSAGGEPGGRRRAPRRLAGLRGVPDRLRRAGLDLGSGKKRLRALAECPHPVPLEIAAHRVADLAVVVDDEDVRCVRHGSLSTVGRAISRMEETITWNRFLERDDAHLMWQRADRMPWKELCYRYGISRPTAHRRYDYALSVIAWRLNGREVHYWRGKRFVIARAG